MAHVSTEPGKLCDATAYFPLSCHCQGLLLLSPSIDVPRTLTLRIMAAIQSIVLQLAPYWRIVPRPALEIVTADLALVRLSTDFLWIDAPQVWLSGAQ